MASSAVDLEANRLARSPLATIPEKGTSSREKASSETVSLHSIGNGTTDNTRRRLKARHIQLIGTIPYFKTVLCSID